VVVMVGKNDLMSAIALNSLMFKAAGVLGPAVAGVLLGVIGVAGCLYLNSLSYLAVVGGYLAMRLPDRAARPEHKPMWHETLDGLRYVASQRVLRAIMALVTIVSLFGLSY